MGEVARPWTKGVTLGERRRSGGHTPSGVCRNLFGTYDRDENTRFVKEELAIIAERERERWNFDFKEEKPKEGRYEWTLLSKDDGDLAPDRNRRFGADQPGTSTDEVSSLPRDAKESTPEKKRGSPPGSKERKDDELLTQTQITDFLRKRKSTVNKKVSSGDSPLVNQDSQVIKVKRRAST